MKRLLIILGLGLALFVVSVWIVIGTGWGLRLAVERADAFLPLELTVEGAEGRLVGPLTLTGVQAEGPGWSLAAERLSLTWQPTGLLDRALVIERMSGTSLALELRPADSSQSAPATVPELESDWRVQLGALDIDAFRITQGERQIVLGDLSLSGRFAGNRLTLAQLAFDTADRRIELTGHSSTSQRFAHDLALSISEPRINLTARGDRQATNLSLSAEPWGLDVTGEVTDLFGDLRWRAQGRMEPEDPAVPGATFDLSGTTLAAQGSLTLQSGDRSLTIPALEVRWQDALNVRTDRWTLNDPPLAGRLAFSRDLQGELAATVHFDGRIGDHPVSGVLQASGEPERYLLTGSGSALAHLTWALSGRGDLTGLQTLEASIDGKAAGSATAIGGLTWAPEFAWEARLQTRALNPEAWESRPQQQPNPTTRSR